MVVRWNMSLTTRTPLTIPKSMGGMASLFLNFHRKILRKSEVKSECLFRIENGYFTWIHSAFKPFLMASKYGASSIMYTDSYIAGTKYSLPLKFLFPWEVKDYSVYTKEGNGTSYYKSEFIQAGKIARLQGYRGMNFSEIHYTDFPYNLDYLPPQIRFDDDFCLFMNDLVSNTGKYSASGCYEEYVDSRCMRLLQNHEFGKFSPFYSLNGAAWLCIYNRYLLSRDNIYQDRSARLPLDIITPEEIVGTPTKPIYCESKAFINFSVKLMFEDNGRYEDERFSVPNHSNNIDKNIPNNKGLKKNPMKVTSTIWLESVFSQQKTKDKNDIPSWTNDNSKTKSNSKPELNDEYTPINYTGMHFKPYEHIMPSVNEEYEKKCIENKPQNVLKYKRNFEDFSSDKNIIFSYLQSHFSKLHLLQTSTIMNSCTSLKEAAHRFSRNAEIPIFSIYKGKLVYVDPLIFNLTELLDDGCENMDVPNIPTNDNTVILDFPKDSIQYSKNVEYKVFRNKISSLNQIDKPLFKKYLANYYDIVEACNHYYPLAGHRVNDCVFVENKRIATTDSDGTLTSLRWNWRSPCTDEATVAENGENLAFRPYTETISPEMYIIFLLRVAKRCGLLVAPTPALLSEGLDESMGNYAARLVDTQYGAELGNIPDVLRMFILIAGEYTKAAESISNEGCENLLKSVGKKVLNEKGYNGRLYHRLLAHIAELGVKNKCEELKIDSTPLLKLMSPKGTLPFVREFFSIHGATMDRDYRKYRLLNKMGSTENQVSKLREVYRSMVPSEKLYNYGKMEGFWTEETIASNEEMYLMSGRWSVEAMTRLPDIFIEYRNARIKYRITNDMQLPMYTRGLHTYKQQAIEQYLKKNFVNHPLA